VPGYSTDRAENYLVDTQRSTTNTLTLSDRKKPTPQHQQQPTAAYSSDDADQTRSSNVPIADFEDDVRDDSFTVVYCVNDAWTKSSKTTLVKTLNIKVIFKRMFKGG